MSAGTSEGEQCQQGLVRTRDPPPVKAIGFDVKLIFCMVTDELRVHGCVEHDLFGHTSNIDLKAHKSGTINSRSSLSAHTEQGRVCCYIRKRMGFNYSTCLHRLFGRQCCQT